MGGRVWGLCALARGVMPWDGEWWIDLNMGKRFGVGMRLMGMYWASVLNG